MSVKYTYAQIAADRHLWAEFVDADDNSDFDSITFERRVQLQIEAFGPETETDDDHD